jgi:predicted small lipoprotein YifL
MRRYPAPRRAVPRRVVLLLAALAVVAGCGSDGPTVSPSAAASTGGEPGRSAAPGTSPATSNLAAFEGRLREATAREGLLVQAIAAASAGSPADLRLAVGQMRDWVAGEEAWLRSNPPETCYLAAAQAFQAALTSMEAAAAGFEALAAASPGPSGDAGGAAAAASLQDVARSLLDAAAKAKTARPDCA